jgi:DNA-nicking Smr family endonuclease
LFTQLKHAYANAKEELIVLTREAAEAEAAGSETTAQRRNRKNREAERERFKMNKQHQEVDAYLTSELIESFQGDKQLAINAVNDDDECPCCLTGWTSFNDIKIVAVLPCNHAMCLQCLNNWQKGWIDSNAALPDAEQSKYFQCPLCRLDLKDDLVQSIAYAFAKRRPGELLTEFRSQLPVTDDEQFTDLVADLLNRNELSLDRTYDCLFNIVGLVEPRPDGSFNPADKQAFYEQARAPVKLLRTELNQMAEELRSIDTESEDGIRLEEKYRLKQDQLNVAMKNAARDIYERVNSKVGSHFEGCVDLHGLHVNEAKEVVVEYVVPVLKAIGRMMIVTGRGLHCSNLTSQLRIRVREYFESLNVECEDIPGNEGAFYVVKN